MRWTALALLFAAACDRAASPRAAAPDLLAVHPPRVDVPVVDAPPPQHADPAVTELSLAPPSAIACDLREAKWSGDLQLRDKGPVFASVAETNSTVSIPQQRGPGWVSVEGSNVDVHGVISKPRLFLAKPIALGGFIMPESTTVLDAPGPHDAGRLNVIFNIADVFVQPPFVRQELGCKAISLLPNRYDARKFVRPNATAPATLRVDTDLRVTPGGPVVARISRSHRAALTVGAWASGERRVVFEAPGYFAFGWVPQGSVFRQPMGSGFGSGFGRSGRHMPHTHSTACSHDLPLFAQVGGERATVGRLKAGATYSPTSPRPKAIDPAFVPVDVRALWLTVAPSALFLVRAADLEGC